MEMKIFFTGHAQNFEVTGVYDTPSFLFSRVVSYSVRSKSHGQQRALEMDPRGSARHGPSLLS